MSFEEVCINNLQEYMGIVFSCAGNIVYRGISDKDYQLFPGIGRKLAEGKDKKEIIVFESEMLTEFSEKIVSVENYNNYTDLAILAQHYGMPTRLLDWTGNPLVALYFSIKRNPNKDAAVYMADISSVSKANTNFDYSTFVYQSGSPISNEMIRQIPEFAQLPYNEKIWIFFENIQSRFKNNNFIVINPKAKTQRVIAQDSIFVLHVDPFIPFDKHIVKKVVIDKKLKNDFGRYLNRLGFHDFSMFPDCDGLCSYLKNKYTL